ncbi:uncharacterized protein NPIL_634561 [Nephila pilipes]|uniref:Uncharacterized protein n=1 Tax=Nephila pilipes TaxID=299642 RepID=A0A8X6T8W6_NEPPI|nr:uncharacterized protein NPIL_634561 [Nephila pilipes]
MIEKENLKKITQTQDLNPDTQVPPANTFRTKSTTKNFKRIIDADGYRLLQKHLICKAREPSIFTLPPLSSLTFPSSSIDICELEAELNAFKRKSDRLENTHSNILQLLPRKEYDAEFEVVEDFRDKAIRIQTKARGIINSQQNVNSVLNSTNDDSVVINSVGNVAVDKRSLDGSLSCNFDVVDQDIIRNDVPPVSYGPWIE